MSAAKRPDRRQVLVGGAALALAPGMARAQAARPLKIGILNDMSSVYADYQGIGSVVSAQLAVDDFSKTLGVPVEIVSADHQNKPDVGSAIARRWIDTENVDVIMDLPNSAVALAVVAVAEEKNKAVIGSGAGSSVMTGPKCSRNFVHWTYDTYSSGAGLGRAVTDNGGKTWFFVTADYTFGKDMEANCTAAVEAAGGKVLGSVRHPINTADFSSFLLQAQGTGADVIAFANGGGDTNGCFKQAHEFGLTPKGGLAAFTLNITNVPALGLEAIQGALFPTAFYWDANDATRAFGKRFLAAHPKKMMPNDMHAGMYGGDLASDEGDGPDEERRRRRQARRRDEGYPDRRSAVRQRRDPRGRPRTASDLYLPSKKADRVRNTTGTISSSSRPSRRSRRSGL